MQCFKGLSRFVLHGKSISQSVSAQQSKLVKEEGKKDGKRERTKAVTEANLLCVRFPSRKEVRSFGRSFVLPFLPRYKPFFLLTSCREREDKVSFLYLQCTVDR